MCSTNRSNVTPSEGNTSDANAPGVSTPTLNTAPMPIKDNIEKSIKKLELINQWISNCDTKSSFILAFLGVVVTIIFTSSIGSDMLATLSLRSAGEFNWETLRNFLCLVLFLTFGFSVICTVYQLYQTLRGRIDPEVYSQPGLQLGSNIFFKTIASKTFAVYETEANIETDINYLNDLNSQIYINSKIVTAKFEHYNASLRSILWAFGIFFAFIVLKNL